MSPADSRKNLRMSALPKVTMQVRPVLFVCLSVYLTGASCGDPLMKGPASLNPYLPRPFPIFHLTATSLLDCTPRIAKLAPLHTSETT